MRMLLTSCSYIPLELPLGAGLPAKRLFVLDGAEVDADGLLPRDFCPYARALMREYDPGDVLAIAGSCDAMRRAYDAIRYWGLAADVFYLDVPRTADEAAVDYFAGELRQMARHIGVVGPAGQVEEQSLRLACEAMNKARAAMAEAAKSLEEGTLRASRLLQAIMDVNELMGDVARWGMTWNREEGFGREVCDALTRAVRAEIEKALSVSVQPPALAGRVRVGVSGTCLLDLSVVECLEEAGLEPVFIDSCMCQRVYDFSVDVNPSYDIYMELARSYLSKPGCPRMFTGDERIARLGALAAMYGAKGLVYFAPKFCDLGYYDFPDVKRGLRESFGLPSLLLEGEYGAGRTGQVLTRAVAFREMLEGRGEPNGA